MAGISSFFNNNFIPLFLLLLLHLGCFFIFSTSSKHHQQQSKKRRKITPTPLSDHLPSPSSSKSSFSSSFSFLKRIFSSSNPCKSTTTVDHDIQVPHHQTTTPTSSISQNYAVVTPIPPENLPEHCTISHSNISSDYFVFPLRNDIFPCPSCGEIFQNPSILEHHQSIKHAVSELIDGDSGKNIVRIIFNTGWNLNPNPKIHRILKIHNSPKILLRFEEYRETVKAKAARNGAVKRRDERCIADGNELLRFHCTTFLCELGHGGNSSICNGQYCSVCGIVRSGFSPKMDGISTMSTSGRAHAAIPDEIEEEFEFMNAKRAMLVCRVVAGRIGCDQDEVDKEDGGFDSVVGGGGSGAHSRVDEDELLVFNPRAVLPCFVIVYTV